MAQLKKDLGLWQGMGLLATSLLGTGIFVVPATAASLAGDASLWAWLLLIGLVLPIAFTFARLGRRYPHAGGAPHLIGLAFGKGAERFSAFLFLAVLPVGLPAALLIAAGFWQALFEMGPWTLWAIQLFTLLGVLLLGVRGARSSGNLQLLIALAILGLTLLIWFKGELSWREGAVPLPDVAQWPAMATALAVMFWCFVGLEAFAHMGEEFKQPERDYPVALLGGVLLAGLIYWVHSLVVLKYGLYGEAADNATAMPTLLALLFGPTAKWLVAILGYLSCFASINIYLQGFARLIWSMAREGKLPPSLAQLSARGAPLAALGLVLGICVVAGSLSLWLQLPLDELIRYANGNFVLVYLLCMAAGWRLLSGIGKGLAGLSVLLCLLVLVALSYQLLYAVLLGAGYGGVSLLRRYLRRQRQQTLGSAT
ncbi:L-methionine/branched-chain amino acid transporter [Aeromonas cavernicola]|uniref:L-methionine/branched-chain amino acid transporter n=1 Tax=Aeromonas cavernicola TaxID=1006623 RepID=A0A2H9U671_9GAMM|nr:L-methionine/branched-chain amino acid transporter [Aeromonas cavernicola]PJG59547.1 L-methionine/branched-chain amino acid transporter [Aeromonas cavernicola]